MVILLGWIAYGMVDVVWVDCVWMSALTHFVWEVIFANVVTPRV